MKINFYQVLSILFICISVGLSYNVKQARQKLWQSEANVVQLKHESSQLKYQLDLLHQAFDLNFNMPAIRLNLAINQNGLGNSHLSVMHLKANACSPCNLPAIKEILHHMWDQEYFIVVSHPTNRYFLSQVLDEQSLNDDKKVIWFNGQLYEEENGYDAEILFVGKQSQVMGCLPLELLKDKTLFEKVIAVNI